MDPNSLKVRKRLQRLYDQSEGFALGDNPPDPRKRHSRPRKRGADLSGEPFGNDALVAGSEMIEPIQKRGLRGPIEAYA